jgi:hypothetical protein
VRGQVLLIGSMLAAIAVAVLTTVVLLLVEPELSKVEAIKTGGLAGGAVVALYALWLNDRRRRTDEARHKQTVLDVLCAYLRRPFTHPSYTRRADDPDQVTTDDPSDSLEADRERQVRFTAQRLITDLLPWGQNPDRTAYHLDLTGASVEYFRLEGRRIGRLTARRTRFYGITRLSKLHASKPALFTGAIFLGRVELREAQFEGGISFQETTFNAEVAFQGASVSTFIDLNTTAPQRQIGTFTITEGTKVRGDANRWTPGDFPTKSITSGEH